MKRILCILMALMLALPATGCAEGLRSYNKQDGYVYVNLGRYPQKADGTCCPSCGGC